MTIFSGQRRGFCVDILIGIPALDGLPDRIVVCYGTCVRVFVYTNVLRGVRVGSISAL